MNLSGKTRFILRKIALPMGAVLVLFVILASLMVPAGRSPEKVRLIRAANMARQIQIAALSVAKDSFLGWPGDLKARGEMSNLSGFVESLVRNGAFQPSDLKIFAGPGFTPYEGQVDANGRLSPPFTDENCAYKIFLVKESDPGNTVFLVSKKTLKGGFVVCRKGGDVSIYKKQQVQNLGIIGQLPGGGTVESAENCLNPGP